MWYLGFDCATKTFAWSLARLDLEGAEALRARADALARAYAAVQGGPAGLSGVDPTTVGRLLAVADELDDATRALAEIADGETVDLAPGVPDDVVGTVARLTALVAYVRRRVMPVAAGKSAGALRVAVEYQCGARERDIAAALVALFSEVPGCRVFLVAAGSKGAIRIGPNPHSAFSARYASSYSANKAHSRACFAAAERLWPSGVAASTAALRGHVADSFLISLSLAKMLAAGDIDAIQARF